MMIVNISINFSKINNETKKYNNELTAAYEALMYIDYYINYSSEKYYVKDYRIYIEGKDGERKNYVYASNNEIRIAYKNQSGLGYTSQPILYEVKGFNLIQNKNVIFIEIVMLSGNKFEKSVGRI